MNEIIFIVDDDDDLRESIAEILEVDRYTVHAFADGESALRELKALSPSLVIMDNMMPGMGGMACIPVMKKECPYLKIIMITAFSTVDNAVAALKSGADDYIAKPFRKDELLIAVRRNLEELRFRERFAGSGMDETLACLSNQIRRQILSTLAQKGEMRFMDITRHLKISDHTKVNFHLKNLKANNLITANRRKCYELTTEGEKMIEYLALLSRSMSK